MMSLSKPLEDLAEASAAGMGGICSTLALFPIERVKTQLQASTLSDGQQTRSSSALLIFRDIIKDGGLQNMFRGAQVKALESALVKFIYFYMYSIFRRTYASYCGPIDTKASLLIGYLAEAAHLPITLPLEVVATALQTSGSSSQGIYHTLSGIYRRSGIQGFYKGSAAYIFLCFQPAIQYTIFEQIKAMMLRKYSSNTLTAMQAFVLGALARAISTVIIYPYIRAKVIMQASKKSVSGAEQVGAAGVISKTIGSEGLASVYRGLGPELFRGVLSSALMLTIKESIHESNRKALRQLLLNRSTA